MATDPTPYILGGSLTEQQRLVAQAEDFEEQAHWLLDRIGVQPGWCVRDIGCGPIGILNLLSDRVGAAGLVVGLDRESRFLGMAQTELTSRGLANVRLVQTDGLVSGLGREAFDFVHERLVLNNLAHPDLLLSEMVALTKPGGIVAVEDMDDASWLCYPPHPSWDTLHNVFHTAYASVGGQVALGRSLPALLRAGGLKDIQVKAHVRFVPSDGVRRFTLLSLLDPLRNTVVGLGLMTPKELADHSAALRRRLEEPETAPIESLLIQAWGRKTHSSHTPR